MKATTPIKLLCVAGARPNFIKIAPLMRAFAAHPEIDAKLVHTGQHYDDALSKVFFEQLGIPRPDRSLEVGSGSHALQTAEIMRRFEPVLVEEQPQVVLVVGDVNSTIACCLVAAKFELDQPFRVASDADRDRRRPVLVHVEAGLRSLDRDMPEEVNRVLTDALCDLLYVSDPAGLDHLANEGVDERRVAFVGNVMIDTLLTAKEQALSSMVLDELGLLERGYGLVTLHRPSNVDTPAALSRMLETLDQLAQQLPLVFPVHPRTRSRIDAAGVALDEARWKLTPPIGYLDFIKLIASARVVLTDSGGIQEETTILGVPCVTLRDNTERPVTIGEGTNILAGTSPEGIAAGFERALAMTPGGRVPRLWDGRSAERITQHLVATFRGEAG